MNVLFKCWAAFCLVIILLCQANKGEDVVTLEPCGDDGVVEVVNNTASQILTVRVNDTRQLRPFSKVHLNWSLRLGGRIIGLADCSYRHYCQSRYRDIFQMETIMINRYNRSTPSAVVLTISATPNSYNLSEGFFESGTALFGKSTLLVEYLFHGNYIVNCSTDFVELAESVECTMVFTSSTKPRSIRSHCDVTKVFSARGRYKCQLYVTQSTGEPKALGGATPMTIAAPTSGYHVSGSCTMTAAELQTAGVNDSYTVKITPGKKHYLVKRRPSSPTLSHNCPAYVTHGDTLDCSCFTSDAGFPPATLTWSDMTSQSPRLLRHNVQRDADSTVLTCLMTWNGINLTAINYTFIVAPDCSATYASGVGLGLGVGSVLMTVVVFVVLAMVFWRKGWIVQLPCADRNKSDRCEVFPAKQAGSGRRLPEVELRAGNQISMQASALNYEILDASKTGLPSNYESLGESSGKIANAKKKRLKKKGSKSQATGVPPIQSNLKEIATEVYENVSL